MNDYSPKNTDSLEQPINKVELTEKEVSAVDDGQKPLSLNYDYDINVITLAASFEIDLPNLD